MENADSRDEMASFIRLSRQTPPDAVLLDVGAHKGLFSIVHLALNPRHRAVLLEPSPPLAKDAAALLRLNDAADRGEVLTVGAGAENAVRRIVTDALGFAQPAADGSGEDVPFTTIDRLCEERRVVPALVKIDVEGAEADVLRGARATLLAHRPSDLPSSCTSTSWSGEVNHRATCWRRWSRWDIDSSPRRVTRWRCGGYGAR